MREEAVSCHSSRDTSSLVLPHSGSGGGQGGEREQRLKKCRSENKIYKTNGKNFGGIDVMGSGDRSSGVVPYPRGPQSPRPWAGAGPWPVGSRAAQREVSDGSQHRRHRLSSASDPGPAAAEAAAHCRQPPGLLRSPVGKPPRTPGPGRGRGPRLRRSLRGRGGGRRGLPALEPSGRKTEGKGAFPKRM